MYKVVPCGVSVPIFHVSVQVPHVMLVVKEHSGPNIPQKEQVTLLCSVYTVNNH